MPRMPGRYSFLFRIARRIFETFSVLRGGKGSGDGHSEAKTVKISQNKLESAKIRDFRDFGSSGRIACMKNVCYNT